MSTTLENDIRSAAGFMPAAAPRLRLVKLVRISKDRDNESSTANQNFDIDAWSDRNDCDIVHTFTEVATSGFKDIPRPKLDDALAMVRNGLADGIIVWKLSRFTRKGAMELFRMLGYARDGAGFLIACHDSVDTRKMDMADIIKLTVIAEQAKAESDAKSDFAKAWHRGRLRGTNNDGKPFPPAGRRPFGYKRPNANTLTVNAAEAKIVKAMADDFLSGKRTLRRITRDLNESGIRKDDGRPWTHRGVAYILKSATIAGGRVVGGAFVRGNWDAIVPWETVEACAARLRDPSRRTASTNVPQYLLTGIATCGAPGCDGSFRAKNHATTGKRYMCKTCNLSVIVAEADAVVEKYVLSILSGDGWKALRASGRTHDASAIEFLTARLDHARTRWMAGKINDAEWDTTHDAIAAQLEQIKSAPIVELPDVDDLETAWHHPTQPLSVEHKRQVISAACESITLMPYRYGLTGYDRVEII